MKILITGASGFLGKFLSKKLKKNNEVFEINSKNCDLTKIDSLKQFDNISFDQIFHLAAWTQAGDFCLKYPADQFFMNQLINTNFLSWFLQKQRKAKIIAIGTSCSYDSSFPLSEEYYLSGKPIDSLFSYAMTKNMLLCGLISMKKQYDINYLYFVPSTLYGKEYHLDGRQMHFIFDLIYKILMGKLYDKKVILWGDGEQKREIIHVDDFINQMLKIVETKKNDIINIGAGEEHSIKDFAKIICNSVSYPFEKIQFDTSKYVGAKSKVLLIDKLNDLNLGITKIPLKKGIEEVVSWFLQNKDTLLRA